MSTEPNEVWDDTFTRIWNAGLIPDPLSRIVLPGRSRAGKTTIVHRLTGSERITFHEQMPLEDLIGGLTLVNGTTQWVDGPATRCLRQGKPLQIDEFNCIPHECVTMLYALMDKPAGITLPTGERVEEAPGYCVIGTMNPTPDCLPHPVYDRVDVFLKAMTLSKGLAEALGPTLAKRAQAVIAHGQAAELDHWQRPVTVNALLALSKLRQKGISDQEAAFMLGFRGIRMADFLAIIAEKE